VLEFGRIDRIINGKAGLIPKNNGEALSIQTLSAAKALKRTKSCPQQE
jgi:hypothetical protein